MKNKILRNALFRKEKIKKMKLKKEKKEMKKKIMDSENKPPAKEVPRTLESTREPDETIVLQDDDETLQDEITDEMAPYFNKSTTPKVLITGFKRAHLKTNLLMKELTNCIPNCESKWRRGADLKKIIEEAIQLGYTDIISIEEHWKTPNGLWLIHLPEGPTAYFKLTSFKRGRDIRGHGRASDHHPEVILNRFSTRIGHTLARMFVALFPQEPQFNGRRVVTFHNQRDYIFIRHHRYIFRNAEKVGLQELGPRITLKLRSVQRGSFDTRFGEYIWFHNRKKMDTSRRRFHV